MICSVHSEKEILLWLYRFIIIMMTYFYLIELCQVLPTIQSNGSVNFKLILVSETSIGCGKSIYYLQLASHADMLLF